MKNILLFAFIVFGMNAQAQITLEYTHDSASTSGVSPNSLASQLMIIKFEVSGEKYVNINRAGKYISVFNMNHSLIKTISFASFPLPPNNYPTILYFSENLFDIDPSMEFMYIYDDSGSIVHTRIYNEDGSILFAVDSLAPWVQINDLQQQHPIYNTSFGTKMILSKQYFGVGPNEGLANVYSLPGTLSTVIEDGNEQLIKNYSISNPYPNPTNSSTRIDYTLPEGANDGEIIFYDLQGKEVKRFKVDKTFDHLLISTADLSAGTYYYQLQTSVENSEGKKIVVIK